MKVEREGLLAEEPERLIGAILRSIPSRSINDYRSDDKLGQHTWDIYDEIYTKIWP